jgi:hypothetical protein
MPAKTAAQLCRPSTLANAGLLLSLFSQITQRVPLSNRNQRVDNVTLLTRHIAC